MDRLILWDQDPVSTVQAASVLCSNTGAILCEDLTEIRICHFNSRNSSQQCPGLVIISIFKVTIQTALATRGFSFKGLKNHKFRGKTTLFVFFSLFLA
jgi:hypothetical protein